MSSINMFGPTRVEAGDKVLEGAGFGGRRPRQVLELLALEAGRVHTRDELAELLWDGEPPHGYVATLHGYICVLRRGLTGVGLSGTLLTVPGGYVVDDRQVDIDLDSARGCVRSGDVWGVLDALELDARGLLVEDPYAEWALAVRESWTEDLARGAAAAADACVRDGQHALAARLARAAVARAPYDEAAVRHLMSALAASGEVPAAIRAFLDLRNRLDAELGVHVQPETGRAYLALLEREPTYLLDEVPLLVGLLRDALRQGEGALLPADRASWGDVGRLLLGQPG